MLSPSRCRSNGSSHREDRQASRRRCARPPRPERLDARGPRLVAKQALEPFFHKAFLPAPDAGLGFAGSPHDLVRADPIGSEQDDLTPPDVLLRSVAIFDESFEPPLIGR